LRFIRVLNSIVKIDAIIVLISVIILGVFVVLNKLSVAKFTFYFLLVLLLVLMIEGMMLVCIGCIGYFGFEKYATWLGRRVKRAQKPLRKDKTDLRLLLILSGLLLFALSFAVFSMIY